MADREIAFQVEGDTEVIAMFEAADRRSGRLKRPFQDIARYFMGEVEANYAGHGSVWGRWPRRKKAYRWPMLEKTGAMRNSFKDRATNKEMKLWNTDPKFKYHQSKKPRSSNLPRRPMLGVKHEQVTHAMKIIQAHVMEKK